MKRLFISLLILYLAAGFVAGCGRKGTIEKKGETVPVRVMKVKVEDIKNALEYVGNIKGVDEAIVYPKVSGKIIEKVKEDGSPINKGEVIAHIDRDEIGLKFEKAPIESPLTGTVGRVYVDIGSSVTALTPIALVADMTNAEINMDIPEKYLPKISLGQEAEIKVDAYPNDKFIGKVTKISPIVDLTTRAAPIEILIENRDSRLQSGMFAKVRLVIEEHKGMPVILKEAVIGKEPDTYVYVIENKKASLRKVKLGMREGPYLEVLDGVKEGDLVVIMGREKLRDGALVEAEE